MKAGDVFLLDGVADIHCWIIISDPAIDPIRVLLVNFTSYDRFADQACILEVGDHPFIKHRTCVNYPMAREASNADLDVLRERGRLIMLESLSPALLQRIRVGAMESVDMELALADILIEQGLVD